MSDKPVAQDMQHRSDTDYMVRRVEPQDMEPDKLKDMPGMLRLQRR
jgi:hypothetical protein